MRVFSYKRNIYNVENHCPSIEKYVALGAEEIGISIFNGFERFADSENTKKVNDEWVFTFDPTPQHEKKIAAANKEQREADIKTAQEAAGLRDYTVDAAQTWIENKIGNARTFEELRDAVKEVLLKEVPYLLR